MGYFSSQQYSVDPLWIETWTHRGFLWYVAPPTTTRSMKKSMMMLLLTPAGHAHTEARTWCASPKRQKKCRRICRLLEKPPSQTLYTVQTWVHLPCIETPGMTQITRDSIIRWNAYIAPLHSSLSFSERGLPFKETIHLSSSLWTTYLAILHRRKYFP